LKITINKSDVPNLNVNLKSLLRIYYFEAFNLEISKNRIDFEGNMILR